MELGDSVTNTYRDSIKIVWSGILQNFKEVGVKVELESSIKQIYRD